jgi:hypothetical protein
VNILGIPQIVLLGDAFTPAVAYISGNRSDGSWFDRAALKNQRRADIKASER